MSCLGSICCCLILRWTLKSEDHQKNYQVNGGCSGRWGVWHQIISNFSPLWLSRKEDNPWNGFIYQHFGLHLVQAYQNHQNPHLVNKTHGVWGHVHPKLLIYMQFRFFFFFFPNKQVKDLTTIKWNLSLVIIWDKLRYCRESSSPLFWKRENHHFIIQFGLYMKGEQWGIMMVPALAYTSSKQS